LEGGILRIVWLTQPSIVSTSSGLPFGPGITRMAPTASAGRTGANGIGIVTGCDTHPGFHIAEAVDGARIHGNTGRLHGRGNLGRNLSGVTGCTAGNSGQKQSAREQNIKVSSVHLSWSSGV